MKGKRVRAEVVVIAMWLVLCQIVSAQEGKTEWKRSVPYSKLMVLAESSRAIRVGGVPYHRMYLKKDENPDDWKDIRFKLAKETNDEGVLLEVRDIAVLDTPEASGAKMDGYRCYVDIPFNKEKYRDYVVVSNQLPKSLSFLFVVLPGLEKEKKKK